MLVMNAPNNNLMTDDFFSGYEYIMSEVASAAEESSIKGLVIHSGGRHFSVGADVNALSERSSAELTKMENENDIPKEHFKQKNCFTFLNELPFPVVSAVNGFCIGSGSEIAVNRGFKLKGNELDLKRAADILIDEFRAAKLGRMTLESVENVLED